MIYFCFAKEMKQQTQQATRHDDKRGILGHANLVFLYI